MRTAAFCICKKKPQISCAVTAQLISAFVFSIRIVKILYYLNQKSQASSHLLWLYSPICVGPGRKPRRPVFSQRGSNMFMAVTHPRQLLHSQFPQSQSVGPHIRKFCSCVETHRKNAQHETTKCEFYIFKLFSYVYTSQNLIRFTI